DEPNLSANGTPNITTTTSSLSGTITSMSVSALAGAVGQGSWVSVGGQMFTVSQAAYVGPTTVRVSRQAVTGTIPSGAWLAVRAMPQFWYSSGVGCSSAFA